MLLPKFIVIYLLILKLFFWIPDFCSVKYTGRVINAAGHEQKNIKNILSTKHH